MKHIMAIILGILFLNGCSTGSDSVSSGGGVATTTVMMSADFQASILPKFVGNSLYKVTVCPVPSTTDSPTFAAGMDCDGDGGIVRYITPSSFQVAFKKLDFIRSDGLVASVIADTGTLANAQVVDLNSPVTLSTSTFAEGTYLTALAEIYYYEIIMPIDVPSVSQTIRVYLSDDDFPQEGNLGHHQGDITFIDAATGNELGWVSPGFTWTVANLLPARGATVGAGGTDPETGHLRGLYGDPTLWNNTLFTQGATQDIYKMVGSLNLTVGSTPQTVTFSFNVKDSWFFEDFDGNQLFNPCTGGGSEACAGGSEWSPLFNTPNVQIQQ